jgi:selenocysteine-specific elongation factor
MPIVGTAGHVDHGKSTLVRALTGTDPDRWEEERRRGLTIDLGFAWTDLGTGDETGFVDVPGHERFIKNMLAGVGAIDVALLVVAADEGWMPQSEEHLAVLDLLEVDHGVVALTRCDLVDSATVERRAAEVADRIRGTSLDGAAVVPVAAPLGSGLAELRSRLAAAVEAAGPPPDTGRPRLWVDRSFVISGAGTVVTGTLTGGTVAAGDELTVYPGGLPVRVRALHHHGGPVETAGPGNRTALNLTGVERHAIPRGAMLGAPGEWETADRFLVDLRTVRSLDEPVTSRGAYQAHVGSGAWPVRLRTLDAGGIDGAGAAVVAAGERIPLVVGDRVVLREVGRRAVVAGGIVLDPAPPDRIGPVRASLSRLREGAAGDAAQRATALLDVRGIADPERLRRESGGGAARAAVTSPRRVLAAAAAATLGDDLLRRVVGYHAANPARPGIPKASLASALGIDPRLLEALVAYVPAVVDDGAVVRARDFAAGWSPAQEEEWQRARSMLADAGLAVPRAAALELDRELFHALVRSGRMLRVAPDLVYLPEQVDRIRRMLQTLPDGFTVAMFRDALGVSRRHAVPLLEWLDREGDTVRRGDVRMVRRRRSPGPGSDGAPPR